MTPMEPVNDSNDSEDPLDAYSAPRPRESIEHPVELTPELPPLHSPFTQAYWGWMFGLVVLFTSLAILGAYVVLPAIPAVIFGWIRSYAYARVVCLHRLTDLHAILVKDPVAFFVKSILLGFLATIASSIAFCVTCFPTSLLLVNASNSFAGIIIVTFACFALAIYLARWMLLATLPKVEHF